MIVSIRISGLGMSTAAANVVSAFHFPSPDILMAHHRNATIVKSNCACIELSPATLRGQSPVIRECASSASGRRRSKPNGHVHAATLSRIDLASKAASASCKAQHSAYPRVNVETTSGDLLSALCVQYPVVTLLPKHTLFAQGDGADAVFYIVSGAVHRLIMAPNGTERLVAILGAGDFCGEEALMAQSRHATSAVTVQDTQVIRLNKAAVVRLLQDVPLFSSVFTTFLLSGKLKTEVALIDQLLGTVEQRLTRALLDLSHPSRDDSHIAVVSNARQEMLAALVGTTRPRINHFLNKFRSLGLIDYGRGLRKGEIRICTSLLDANKSNGLQR